MTVSVGAAPHNCPIHCAGLPGRGKQAREPVGRAQPQHPSHPLATVQQHRSNGAGCSNPAPPALRVTPPGCPLRASQTRPAHPKLGCNSPWSLLPPEAPSPQPISLSRFHPVVGKSAAPQHGQAEQEESGAHGSAAPSPPKTNSAEGGCRRGAALPGHLSQATAVFPESSRGQIRRFKLISGVSRPDLVKRLNSPGPRSPLYRRVSHPPSGTRTVALSTCPECPARTFTTTWASRQVAQSS